MREYPVMKPLMASFFSFEVANSGYITEYLILQMFFWYFLFYNYLFLTTANKYVIIGLQIKRGYATPSHPSLPVEKPVIPHGMEDFGGFFDGNLVGI